MKDSPMQNSTVQQRAANIRLLALDVDGVLTDGRLYFGPQGEALKIFHVRDGAGLVHIRKAGIEIAIISGRQSAAVDARMKELGIVHVKQGVGDKRIVLQQLKDELHIKDDGICCVGDDTPDLAMFSLAHFAIAVADAHQDLKAAAHHVTQLNGGQGAVREVCDLLLQHSIHVAARITA